MGSLSALTEPRALVIQLNHRDPFFKYTCLQGRGAVPECPTLTSFIIDFTTGNPVHSRPNHTFLLITPSPDRVLYSLAVSS